MKELTNDSLIQLIELYGMEMYSRGGFDRDVIKFKDWVKEKEQTSITPKHLEEWEEETEIYYDGDSLI